MSDHETIRCATPGCSNDICLDPATVRRLRETHASFYCPLGHSNYFPGKTTHEKQIEQLQAEVQRLTSDLEWARRSRTWVEDELTRERTTCPWTGCGRRCANEHGLRTHMRATHGMPTLAAVRQHDEEQAS